MTGHATYTDLVVAELRRMLDLGHLIAAGQLVTLVERAASGDGEPIRFQDGELVPGAAVIAAATNARGYLSSRLARRDPGMDGSA